ncbi:TRAP transporter large permease subunit [Mesobacillus maritimus]|uniref:TRAP transporter large permease n=1 Tax=Mesobacillus maritimus TaxID=1643336 RepID=UPI00203CD9B2|nr:TRAP transporter large permease subunit [Mesobacillus maritimus]MCM3584174.1 TRAP transporter large permease subunit [Mesobacillus maritimus]
MDAGIIALLLFGSLLVLLFLGVPIAFGMGGISLIFGFIFWGGLPSFEAFSLGAYGKVTEFVLSAVPLYLLMAAILQYSDLADDMYEAVYRWFGGLRGGLAVGTTLISSIFAAMVGIATVATATLGLTARPSMLSRGYDDKLTTGTIIAGGALGILIPPSIIMIIYASEAAVSPGAMFMGGIVPGILAAVIFIGYVLIKCGINPEMGPAIRKDERFSLGEKLESIKSIFLPLFVIVLVLGSIYTGAATPTEAAAVGVVGALISAAIKKKLTKENIKKIFAMSVRVNAMVFWILISAVAYSRIVSVTGVGSWFADFVTSFEVNAWVTLIAMQLVFFVLGMFIDPAAIILMTGPLFLPVVTQLGFDPVWYGVIFVINMCMAYMTPPFGFNLFVMRGIASDLNINTIYRSVWPFVGLYALVIVICMFFPQLVLWLPNLMIK